MAENSVIDHLIDGAGHRSLSCKTFVSVEPGSGRQPATAAFCAGGLETVQTFAILKMHSIAFGGGSHGL